MRSRRRTILLLAAAVALVVVLVVAGVVPPRSDEGRVERAVEGFTEAVSGRDFGRVCDDYLARDLREQVDRLGGCAVAIGAAVDVDEENGAQDVEVVSVEVTGDTATARLRRNGEERDLGLVREEGDWRIAAP